MSLLAVQVCAAVKLYNNHDLNESSHNDILYAKVKAKNMEKFDDKIKSLLWGREKNHKMVWKTWQVQGKRMKIVNSLNDTQQCLTFDVCLFCFFSFNCSWR